MSGSAARFYPLPSKDELCSTYVGRTLHEVPVPAAIVDLAKFEKNCELMHDAVSQLGLSFRPHVKTHKTTEGTRLQIGQHTKDVRVICSSVIEAENLVPLMFDYKEKGAKVNVLYGVPLGPSQTERLAAIAKDLGPDSVALMIDNISQLPCLVKFNALAGTAACVFLKTDAGYHRAGIAPSSKEMIELIKQVSQLESQGVLRLLGFYSHNSLSYGGSHPDEAMDMLRGELEVCKEASKHLQAGRSAPLVISVGASPSVLSVQNILSSNPSQDSASAKSLRTALDNIKSHFELELHAGVYPLLDIQQVSARSRHMDTDLHDSIAFSVLAEVCSLYPQRTDRPEALISAGLLALAREPCKDYAGWGVVTPWGMPDDYKTGVEDRIIVARISQEHGILAYENTNREDPLPVEYGQKLQIWSNHACITMSMFGWYYVVDSNSKRPDEIVDIWVRWRGW